MSWPEFLYDQTALDKLCVDWDIQPLEFHPHNQMYGFDQLLREYAGLPSDPLPWTMEHFISFGDPQPYSHDVQSQLPLRLAVSEETAEALRQFVDVPVHAIGSAFFYMRESYHRRHPGEPAGAERRGTLVFPDKSTMNKDTDFDRDRFARELAALPEEFQPVYVSIFWKDFLRGTHLPFVRAGLKVVTSGHAHDPLFLFRQYDLCRRFRYACANDLSTSFCMSVLAGCRFFYWPSGPLRITVNGVTQIHDQEPTIGLPGKQQCLAASSFPPLPDRSQQLALAEQFAGRDCVRTAGFFRELFADGNRRLFAVARTHEDVDFDQRWQELLGWNARGIDRDGWTLAECRFEVAARPGSAGIRLRLSVPRRPDKALQGRWTMWLDEEPQSLVVTPGRWLLEIPCRANGLPRKVRIQGDGTVPLGPDPRHRAFRIKDISWQCRLTGRSLTRLRRWHLAYSAKGERLLRRLWAA